MSYRDLRNFTELLRILGCPQQVSLESFRNPNFPLLAELLVWLSRRFDQDADLPEGPYETEQDRVLLIRSAAQFLALKASIKLNTRRLYAADGHAVRELLKIATLLKSALDAIESENNEEDTLSYERFDINDKVNELKETRQLASEITVEGAALHDLLGSEIEIRPHREMSIARQVELRVIESAVKEAINELKKEIERTQQLIENVSVTEASLDQRIERKKAELERSRNRLQTLQKVRPAFLDEFSALEKELQVLYSDYVSRYRTVVYLESLVEEQERNEAQRAETEQEAARKLAEQMRLEEEIEEGNEVPEQDTNEKTKNEMDSRLRVKTGLRQRPSTRVNSRVFGTMNPGENNSESSLDTTTDSESEDILLNGDDIDLGMSGTNRDLLDLDGEFSDGDSDIEIQPQQPPMAPRRPSARVMSSRPRPQSLSDDDF